MSISDKSQQWERIFSDSGPRNFYPQSYVVSWYFRNVKHEVSRVKDKKVLDLGCGTSPNLILFHREGFDYYGIDVTSQCFGDIFTNAKKWHINTSRIHLQTFVPPKLPFINETFDIVVGLESIHFNNSSEQLMSILAEIKRVMKKNSHYFFTTIDKYHFFLKKKNAIFINSNCIEISDRFPIKARRGLRYFLFNNIDEINNYFKTFSSINIGRYYLDKADGRPDSYFLIFGTK